jgi:hypothetical protein
MVIGSLASIPRAILGSRITGRLSERQFLRAIAVALLIVGLPSAGKGRSAAHSSRP